jgi:Polymorphic toxin system, DSP-PTPase phosphatase
MTITPVPFPRSYWVIPGKLLAGCYPGAKNPKEAAAKLTALIDYGIRHVINLMEPDERDSSGHRFVPYDDMMESIAAKMQISVTFDQLPIKDLSVPTEQHMTRILNQIDLCIKHKKPVHVHCWGGIGRTGTVVGCYLVRHGLASGKNVLDMIRDLRKDTEDSDRRSPETREQREMVFEWLERKCESSSIQMTDGMED